METGTVQHLQCMSAGTGPETAPPGSGCCQPSAAEKANVRCDWGWSAFACGTLQPQAQQIQHEDLATVKPVSLNRKRKSTAYLVLSGPQAQIAQRARSSAGQSDVLAPHHVDQGRDGAALHEGCVVLRLEREGLQGPRRGRLLLGRACKRQHTRAVSAVRCAASDRASQAGT